jgi:hypothetical protein
MIMMIGSAWEPKEADPKNDLTKKLARKLNEPKLNSNKVNPSLTKKKNS